MKNRIIYPLLLLWVTLFLSCENNGEEHPRPRPAVADQTLLFHFAGQSLMPYFRDTNIPEIRTAIEQQILCDSRLLVYIQPSRQQSLLIEYSYDYATRSSRADTLRRYEGSRSIDKEHIVEVLNDVGELAPANRYAMVLGSHGGGWVPAKYSSLQSSEEEEGLELRKQPQNHESHDWLHKSAGADATRWYGEHAGQTTDIATWAEAFAEASIQMEYLVFDACFMSNIETLYDLRHAARYIVASPCEIMGRGMPYSTMLPHLFQNQGKEYDLEAMCRAFHDFYSTTTSTRQSGCLALTVCDELEALADATAAVMAGPTKSCDTTVLQVYEGLDEGLFFDFKEYIEAIGDDTLLLEEFQKVFDRAFPEACRLHTPAFYSGYNGQMNPITYYSGVTTSTPSTKFPKAYAQTAWAQKTGNDSSK